MRKSMIAALIVSGLAWGQVNQKAGSQKSGAATPAKTFNAETALSDVDIVKDARGSWKCVHAGGRPCTSPEVELLTVTINKSISNTKNNLTGPDGNAKNVKGVVGVKVILLVAADGTLKCTTEAGRACSESDMQYVTTKWNAKAESKPRSDTKDK